MVALGGEIILLNCCKWLQMRQDFLSGYGCLYRKFVTWKMVLGHDRLAEELPTRWRPLYDDYGPVRPGLLRRSAVPSPEPRTTPAVVRVRLQRGNPAAKLAASAGMQQNATIPDQGRERETPPTAASALSFLLRPVVSGLGV